MSTHESSSRRNNIQRDHYLTNTAVLDPINDECWRGLQHMWQRDLRRDCAIAKALNLTLLTPFLDEDLIRIAMQFPGSQKIVNNQKKFILRQSAESLGLPKEFVWRKKIAAQYGSKFDKAIERLAKQHNFKSKQDYLSSVRPHESE